MKNFKFTSTLAQNPDWIFQAILDVDGDTYVITNESVDVKFVMTMSREDVEYNFEKGCYKFVH